MSDKNTPASGFQYGLANLKPAEPLHKDHPHLPRRRQARISQGHHRPRYRQGHLALARQAHGGDGARRRGRRSRRSDRAATRKIEFITRDDPRALELIRHDAAHVLAEAVQSLWPGTQVTIGPVIENGFYYDFFRNEPFTPEDFAAIEKKMREIIARDKPFTKEVWDREKTKQVFRDKGENFKVELVDAIPGDEPIKIYYQGDWFDLCRGPHMTSTGKIGNAFKLMKVAGAYWRGDSNNPMLTRIYGTAFAKQEELDAYLKQIEEAEKRDHRKLGRELDLFHFQEEGPGVVFWHAKGWTIFQALIAYMRRRLTGDYSEVNAPQILDKVAVGDLRPLGLVPREHVRGAIGRRRGRGQALVCAQADELPRPCADLQARPEELSRPAAAAGRIRRGASLRAVGRDARPDARARLHPGRRACVLHRGAARRRVPEDQRSDPVDLCRFRLRRRTHGQALDPAGEARRHRRDVGSRRARDGDRAGADRGAGPQPRIKTAINPGEGAFYGPKFEYVLRDAIGRDWQCGTTQVDFNLPERFGAFYIDADGSKKAPVMVHRAICGSMERFIGILIEHFAGNFPLWLAPVQAVVTTITSEGDEYAKVVAAAARRAGLRVEIDLRNEKINYKVREHSLAKIPALLVVGKKEAETPFGFDPPARQRRTEGDADRRGASPRWSRKRRRRT